MKARRKHGQSKSPGAGAPRRRATRNALIKKDRKSNTSSPDSFLNPRRSSSRAQTNSGNSSSTSELGSALSKRSVSRGKAAGGVVGDRSSNSRTPPDKPGTKKCPSSSPSKRSNSARAAKAPPPKISVAASSSAVVVGSSEVLVVKNNTSSVAQAQPDLNNTNVPRSSKEKSSSIVPVINNNDFVAHDPGNNTGGVSLDSDLKITRIESGDGRRTSTRQRKPSWRVNFDPSDLLDSPSKLSSVTVTISRGTKSNNFSTEKTGAKRTKLELGPGVLAAVKSAVANGDSPQLLILGEDFNDTDADPDPAPVVESVSPIPQKSQQPEIMIVQEEPLTNGTSNNDLTITSSKMEVDDVVVPEHEPEPLKPTLNGTADNISHSDTNEVVTEVIDITEDDPNDIPYSCSEKPSSPPPAEVITKPHYECCCSESDPSHLQADPDSAEAFASDYLSDKDESPHLPSEWFCQAIDLVGSDKIGCYRPASEDLIFYRVSSRCPFRLLCTHHIDRLKLHQCCPICGYFCTHGEGIMLCTENWDSGRSSVGDCSNKEPKWTSHLFHKACATEELSEASPATTTTEFNNNMESDVAMENKLEILDQICCPHCGENGDIKEISLTLQASLPVSVPSRPPATRKIAVVTCRSSAYVPQPEDNTLRYVEESTATELCHANEEVELLLSEALVSTDKKSFLKYLLSNDLSRVMAVISCNRNLVNTRFKSRCGQSPLHLAVASRNICLVHGLIVGGANPDIIDNEYVTPLMLSAKLNEPTLAKYLIAAGADKFHKDPSGMNVIHISASAGNLMVLQGILEDHVELLETVDNRSMTALMHAAKNVRTDIVNYLATFWPLENHVRAVDCEKNTPLHWAAGSGAVQAVSTLLKHGADVNAKNILDQTPLHWAVLHGRDGSVLTLLVNQAEISLTDAEGKTPLDLCSDGNDNTTEKYKENITENHNWNNHESLNSIKKTIKQCMLQTITLRSRISQEDNKSLYRVVSKDISRGREPHNVIQCVNSIDDTSLPEKFIYICSSVYNCKTVTQSIKSVSETHFCSCDPVDGSQDSSERTQNGQAFAACLLKSCPCSEQNYDVKERLFFEDDESVVRLPFIQECNQLCGCDARLCCNRVVQRGSKCELQVFRTQRKGWGVKSLGRIPRGAFVCTYEGEIIDSFQAAARVAKYEDYYMFDLHGGQILLDSTIVGNVARFINHSCMPNLVPIKVITENQDRRFPVIAFFAKVDIQADEEITYDYGPKFWIPKIKQGIYCACESDQCSYSREDEEDHCEDDDDVFSSQSDNGLRGEDQP